MARSGTGGAPGPRLRTRRSAGGTPGPGAVRPAVVAGPAVREGEQLRTRPKSLLRRLLKKIFFTILFINRLNYIYLSIGVIIMKPNAENYIGENVMFLN